MTKANSIYLDDILAAQPSSKGCRESAGPARRVLVMDDEEAVCNVIGSILATMGCLADMTKNGEAALASYIKAKSRGVPFDAVILDLHVSRGMNGRETMKKLLEFDPDVKAVVTSGDFTDPWITDFRVFGFKEALPKPFRPAELKKALLPLLH
ncbi:MAG TPA: response regulator [Nitrospirota bacterium]